MNQLKLYEISNQYEHIFNNLYDEETGEILETVQKQLNALDAVRDKKCVAVAAFIKNMEAERDAIKTAKENMATREKRYKNRIEYLEHYLKDNMQLCGITKLSHPEFEIKLKESQAVDDDIDLLLLPTKYQETVTETKVLKAEIRKALMNGEKIPGAKLKTNLNLSIK
jgi:hypothetical protein